MQGLGVYDSQEAVKMRIGKWLAWGLVVAAFAIAGCNPPYDNYLRHMGAGSTAAQMQMPGK